MSTKATIDISFLAGGGEMGALTRSKDWSTHKLGEPHTWHQSLRTALSIVLNSKFPMFIFWGPDQVCFYNDAYRPSLGNDGKHPHILGMNGKEAWPEIWNIISPLLNQVMAGGESTWSEDQLIPIYRNGRIENVYWTYSYSPVIGEDMKPAGVLVTCMETTEKVLDAKKIMESEANFRQLADALPQKVSSADSTGKFTYFNEQWRLYTGMAAIDLGRWDWKKIIHPEEYQDFIKRRTQAIEAQHEFEMELRLRNSHHVYHWHLYRCRPVIDTDGKVQKWIASTTDIQKQKEKNRELSNFAHIVSHDLKAPLRGIAKIADWLVMDYKEVLDETGKDYLNMMVSRVNTLEDLINGILKYSMSGQLDEDQALNDLNLIVNDVKEMFSLNENVKITVETALPSLMISRTAILQVFENLVSNAVKHNDKDVAEIKIGMTEQNHNWKFYVKDNGPGIDPQYHEKVFMIFQTLKTRDVQNSTGIGLGIVKKVVEQLGGQVWIESEEGKGCTFFFTLSK